jgi:hypothetical protein
MKDETGAPQLALLDRHLTAIGLEYVRGNSETYTLPRFQRVNAYTSLQNLLPPIHCDSRTIIGDIQY